MSVSWMGVILGVLALGILLAVLITAVAGWRALLATLAFGLAALVLLVFTVRFVAVSSHNRLAARPTIPATSSSDPDWRARVEKAIASARPTQAEFADETDDHPAPKPKTPSWVESPPGLVDGVYQMVVTVGPYKTWEECEKSLDEKLREGAAQYVETYAERDADLDPRAVANVNLPLDYVRKSVVKEIYPERIVSPTPAIGTMLQLKVLLGFDRETNARIQEAARSMVVAERIRWSGIGLAGVLLSLLVAYGYLKMDLATKGVYRGRLRFAALVMILGVCAAAVLAVVA